MSDTDLETKEMKAAQNDFASTFQAFKDANDERLAALEQKQGDGLLTDKVDRINAALDAQSKRIENLSISASRPAIGGEARAAMSPLPKQRAVLTALCLRPRLFAVSLPCAALDGDSLKSPSLRAAQPLAGQGKPRRGLKRTLRN